MLRTYRQKYVFTHLHLPCFTLHDSLFNENSFNSKSLKHGSNFGLLLFSIRIFMRLIELNSLASHNLLIFGFYIICKDYNYEIFVQKDMFSIINFHAHHMCLKNEFRYLLDNDY